MMDAKVKYIYIKMLNKVNSLKYWTNFWGDISNKNNNNNVLLRRLSKDSYDFLQRFQTTNYKIKKIKQ